MSRAIATAILTLALVAVPARGLAIEPRATVDGATLASAESGLDGTQVTLEGEVISETLSGGKDAVWVNVLSGDTAIGVWMSADLAENVEVFGSWSHTGDTVSVTGVFSEACDVHGGDLDIHATELTVVERGSERHHPVSFWKLGLAFGGLAIAFVSLRRSRRIEDGDGA